MKSIKEEALGRGKVILIGTDLGTTANTNMTVTARDIFEKILNYCSPKIRISGSHYVNINVAEKNGKTLIHLFNLSVEHNNAIIDNTDEILPIPSLKLTLKKKPKKAVWQPENKKLKVFKNGNSYFVFLPPLHIHSIVEITF